MPKVKLNTVVPEGASARLTAKVVDESGAPISGSHITSLLVTLYELDTKTIINNRDRTNILLSGEASISSGGILTWNMTPADMAILKPSKTKETHVALFEWTWGGGKIGRTEVIFTVYNFAKA